MSVEDVLRGSKLFVTDVNTNIMTVYNSDTMEKISSF